MANLKLFFSVFCLILLSFFKVNSKELMCEVDSSKLIKHEYVDLGLPSGTLWATMNIGAFSLEDDGDFFSWGEVRSKKIYSLSNYMLGKGDDNDEESLTPTKYNDDPKYSVVDSLYTLSTDDDAAFVEWGTEWRMPTYADFLELIKNCKWKWKKINGNYGYKVKAKNGNWIFLPAAGLRYNDQHDYRDESFYWTSTLYEKNSQAARLLYFNSKIKEMMAANRCSGCTIRPVRIDKAKR